MQVAARVDAAAVAPKPLAPAQLGSCTLERRGQRGDQPVGVGEDRIGGLRRGEQPAAARGGGERPARPVRCACASNAASVLRASASSPARIWLSIRSGIQRT